MNQTLWNTLTPRERDAYRAANPQNLTPQLIGLEHCQV